MSSMAPDPNLLKKYPNAVTSQQLSEKDRFLGTLLGLHAGESVGAPHEFKKAAEIIVPKELVAGGPWKVGEPTDDTELTLALLRSLVARRRVDLVDIAQSYLRWFGGNPKDVGNLTKAALQNLRAGEPPDQSGALAWEDSGREAAGNGSVMCCAPIGLLHVKQLEGLVEDASQVSRITHFDPRCVGGCVAVTTAIALLVRGGTQAEEAISRAASAGGEIHDDVRMVIERGASKKPDQLTVDGKDMGFVLVALEIAFSALASAATFEEGILAVVARGGDTDTNGAIAGALLGAKFGKNQVPERWASKLKAGPDLLNLGDQLYRAL
ncbi:MAG: ADP-ribosylglycohydrolase family protein [Deltaproteobacteria bacterium]|nr:ADP-ribosylglycohydrolase family protein [Deltaproteobacteria bacterium]